MNTCRSAVSKCVNWLAAVVFLSVMTSLSQAQQPAFVCVANGGAPPTVRAEGLAELTGDLVVTCTGGVPTAAGAAIPQGTITLFLNTNVTSRLTLSGNSPFSEALLLIDEPNSPGNPNTPLTMCDPMNVNNGVCSITGTGTGIGVYNGTASRPNVFQGQLTASNAITFYNVPIDPSGTMTNRILRITGIRANANQLGTGNQIPTQVVSYISISYPNSISVINPQQTMAFCQTGTTTSKTSATLASCAGANPSILQDPNAPLDSGPNNGAQASVAVQEQGGIPFKAKNIAQVQANAMTSGGIWPQLYPSDKPQNISGQLYNTESGFENGTGTNPFTTARGANLAGVADQGTRVMLMFSGVPNGVRLFVPAMVALTSGATNRTGTAVLTSTDVNGGGPFNPVTANANGLVNVALTGGQGSVVYEVLESSWFFAETLTVPVAAAFPANLANGGQVKVSVSLGPLSATGTASDFSTPIPRFAYLGTNADLVTISNCIGLNSPSSASFGATTARGAIQIAPSSQSATWTASSQASWIIITSLSSGTGSYTLTYSVSRNTTGTARTGTITINGQAVTITQSGLVPGDFDRNGVPDLTWQNDSTRSVGVWYLSGPTATTLSGIDYPAPASYPGWTLVGVADFDGNGVPDLAWQNDSTRQVGVWYMGGALGTTLLGIAYPAPGVYPGWRVVSVADMDGNGVPDLVWQSDSTRAVGTWYMGGPQGTTLLSVAYQAGGVYAGWTLVGVGDFDGNGVPDLVWQNDSTRAVGVWYMGGAQGLTLLSVDYPAPGTYPGWKVVAVQDMNQDGVPDLVWQNDSTRAVGTWYMGGSTGTTLLGTLFQAPGNYPGWRATGAK